MAHCKRIHMSNDMHWFLLLLFVFWGLFLTKPALHKAQPFWLRANLKKKKTFYAYSERKTGTVIAFGHDSSYCAGESLR